MKKSWELVASGLKCPVDKVQAIPADLSGPGFSEARR